MGRFAAVSFSIEGFMLDMGLSGTELFVYALIHSYSKGAGLFYASSEYLAEAAGVSRRTVQRVLCELISLGAIERCSDGTHEGYRTTGMRSRIRSARNRPKGHSPARKSAPAANAACGEKRDNTAEFPDTEHRFSSEALTEKERELLTDALSRYSRGEGEEEVSEERLYGTANPDDLPAFHTMSFGKDALVNLTARQYLSLASLVDPDVLVGYFARLERLILDGIPSGVYPHSHYRTLKRWIESDMGV